MKKFRSTALFAILLVVSIISTIAFAGCNKTPETFKYTDLGDQSYEISLADGKISGDIIIPSQYNDKPVSKISDYAFRGCSRFTSITIPNSVTTIGKFAFENCRNCKFIIPESLTYIGVDAFHGMTNCSIEYLGTKGQWRTRVKGYLPPTSVSIVCSDGELDRNN